MGIRIRTEPASNVVPATPPERATLGEVATEQRQNQAPASSATATPTPTETTPATQQADQVLQSGNRHVQTVPSAPAADPVPEVEVSVTANAPGGPTAPAIAAPAAAPGGGEGASPAAIPNVATGPAPTGSASANPQEVAQRAASDTARVTPTGAATAAPATASAVSPQSAQVGNLQLSFEPNSHNQYDRVAYVFKLCMVNDLDAEDPNLLNKFLNNEIRKVVIAESGVTTGFAIGDVEITDAISANFRNRSNMTTGLRIQIVEPYSLTLPDKMYQASLALGVRNWRLAPFLLQMEFRYIKADGSLYTPSGSQKLIKVYQLIITEFDAQLTETGAKYDVQAGVKGNLGFRDAYQILPQSHRVEVSPGDTDKAFGVARDDNKVNTFFTKLGDRISKMYVELREKNTSGHRLPLMVYKFIVEPALGNQEINFVQEANSRRNSFEVPNSTTGNILVSRGISVTALVDDILASLKDPSFFIQNMDAGGLVKIPVIECVTRNVGWDLLTNDYVREFTFFIRLKDSNRPVPTSQYGQAVQSDPNLQQSRMQEVSKNLKKRYDYFYTGLNTEIINCDIKFNQMHIISQPLLQVTTPMTYASANRVSPNDPNLTGEIPAGQFGQAQAQAAQQLQNISNQQNTLGTDRNVNEEDLGRQATELASRRQLAENRLKEIAKASIVPFEVDQSLITLLAPVSNTGAQAAELRSIAQRVATENAARAASREFVEDINLAIRNNMLELSYYADPRDVLNSFARPTVIEAGGGNNQPGGTRPMVTSILSQIYDRSGQHLLEIDLEIRGDPYWLGVTDLERTQELLGFLKTLQDGGPLPERLGVPTAGNAGTTSFSRDGLVDKHDQDANILLRFRAGSPPKEDTGFQNLNEGSTFFYGVYTVIECIHEFKAGKFTQRLKAFRDVLINVDQLRAAERTAVNTTQPRQVQAVTPGAPNAEQAANNPSNAQLTNPNASPANLTRSTQASEVGSGGQTTAASGGYISGNSPEAIAQRQAEGRTLLAQVDAANNSRGTRAGLASLTGEGALRDPADSLYRPRQQLSVREVENLVGGVSQADLDAVTARNRAAAGR